MMEEYEEKKQKGEGYPLDDCMLERGYVTATAFFAFLGEWLILLLTSSMASFFIPLTPSFTLHSTSSSLLNATTDNHFITSLAVGFHVHNTNLMGTTINYDSFHVSLFHRHQKLSTFSLLDSFQQPIQAEFPNVSVPVDQWAVDHSAVQAHGTSCGVAHLDLWFTVNAIYAQPMWPRVRDKLQGHCGEVKFELCSSTVVHSFLASCDVYSDLVHKVRLVFLVLLLLLLVTASAVPLLVEHFFCCES